ncbi:LysR family transcriptional regulator [Pseudomonas aeruginosa]|uniref:LysR family transcriptional regulator n=1 Tax=Pseudomonas aeruginosa TaxID=287 RepID=UPI003CC608A6
MKKPDLTGLAAFVAIARERSFRRAAATLGVTPPTLSHTLRELETQLGIRLLNRTTRNVSPTEAGEHLLAHLDPAFEDIAAALDSLNRFRETPHGLVRINASRNAIGLVLAPRFGELARDYPGITLEVVADEGFANIVEAGFDAGIRLGEDLQHGMRAVRVGPEELLGHRCIGWRKVSSGELYKWQFSKGTKALSVAVSGPLVLDDPRLMLQAALADVGIAFAIEEEVAEHLAAGRLERVLVDWCAPFPGFHLYYPNRRNHPAALSAVIDLLRYPGEERPGPA